MITLFSDRYLINAGVIKHSSSSSICRTEGRRKKKSFRSIILCFFLLSTVSGFSQSKETYKKYLQTVDSLQNLLKVAKEDTNKVFILNALSFKIKEKASDNAVQYAEQALQLSQKLSFKKGQAISLSNLGLIYKVSNNLGKAASYDLQSLKIQYEIGNKKEIIKSLSTIAELYKAQRDYDEAMAFYIDALKLAEEVTAISKTTTNPDRQIEDKKQQAGIIYLIGKLYQNQKDYVGSLKYLSKSLKIYEEIKDEKNIADVSISIGIAYYDRTDRDKSQTFVFKGIHKEAFDYLVKARTIYLKNNNKNGIIRADNHLAYISAGQEKFDVALEYAFEGLELSKEIKNDDLKASLYGTIGDIYFAQGKYKEALEYLDKCFKGAKAVNNREYIRDLYLSFSSIYAKLDNYKKAYEFHTLYTGMKDALIKGRSNKEISEMSARYESEKKDKELIAKDAEIALQQAETQKQQFQRNAFIIGFGIVLILAFFIFRGYRNITQQKVAVEKSYKNLSILSEIEQEITASLSVEKIIEKVYENVNKLMKADVLCIGIPNAEKNTIEFPGFIENGKKYSSSYDLNDDTRFPVLCYKNGQEFFINDLRKEYKKYIPYIPIPVVGDRPESLIYLPLFSKGKIIGVITVESFSKNAYTKYHFDILKNLAVYIAIAIENAQLYENLEGKIEERTVEVLKQKEEVEKSYENTKLLSNIGREIGSVLSVEEIINKTYQNINKLMDASAFGIGIYNKYENRLDFSGFIEKGEKLPFFFNDLSEEKRPAIWCYKNQKELITNDFKNEYTNYFPGKTLPFSKAGDHVESLIYLPLSTANKNIGVITVQCFKQNAYTEYQVDILRNLATYMVNALENAHLYKNMEEEVKYRTQEVFKQKEELEISRNNLNVLSEIGQELTSTLNFESIFSKLHENINRLMNAETFGVRIFHPELNSVEIKYEFDKGIRQDPFSFSMDDDDNFTVWCIKNKKEIFLNDINDYGKYVNKIVTLAGENSLSLMFCPMILKEVVIGVITVQSYQKNSYTEHHLKMLRTLANYTAIALDNAQLYENLEEKIKERTIEVLKQKEEVEKSYENTKLLSNIGREITSILAVEEIIDKVYQNVNKLMDASVFGIGIFNKKENRIEFIGVIEKGKSLPNHFEEMTDESRPAILCFNSQQELFSNDFKNEHSRFFPGKIRSTPIEGEGAESLIYLPLSTSNKRIGVITVQSFRQNAYTEYQLDILRNLAIYTVNALENAHLYENMEEEVKFRTQEVFKQKEELEISRNNINVLSEIGQEITSSLSIEKIIEKVYENVNKLMDASVFTIGIYNEEENQLDFIGTIENGEKIPFLSVELTGNDRLPSKCFNERKIIFIKEYQEEYKKYSPTQPTPIAGIASESIIYIPLISKDKPIGVITVQSVRKNAFTEYHLNILQSVAIYAAIAIENAQLYENLEETVVKRTDELLKQKEEVEKSYQNTKLLSDIGREITAVLSVEEIIKKVYENVNKLMDATAFGIGIFDETEQRLNFSGFIEKGEKLPFYYNELNDESRPAVWCFKQQKEIFINDLKTEYNNYFPGRQIPVPKAGEQSESIIYLPISTASKRIGVITVQSFKENAYSEYQLNILRNLAIYVVNGLENARLYENMEEEVIARTLEIEKQKDELARLSIVASETDNGVLIFGATGEIEWVNSGFTRLQGYGLDELKLRGNTLEKMSHNPEIGSLVRECIVNKKSSIYQALNITKFGKELWVQSSLTPIMDDSGNIKKWVMIDTDVTERKKAEDNIRQQNEKITDSINYAKSIQEALLPPIEEIQRHLPESFILYKPKDIVSGDFYWIYEDKERVLVAVADCTGHGVPGAFMSLMGNNFLNDIIKVKGKFTPSEILDDLNIQILNTLKQNSKDTSVKYGMDIALISLEGPVYGNSDRSLQFAGAHSPLFIFRDDKCISIKGNQRSIGSFQKSDESGFSNQIVQLKKGDMLYMFSDGYADQIGGQENKKIFSQPFKEILQSVCKLEMSEQKKILDHTITNWQGIHNQTDDILVVGIRI